MTATTTTANLRSPRTNAATHASSDIASEMRRNPPARYPNPTKPWIAKPPAIGRMRGTRNPVALTRHSERNTEAASLGLVGGDRRAGSTRSSRHFGRRSPEVRGQRDEGVRVGGRHCLAAHCGGCRPPLDRQGTPLPLSLADGDRAGGRSDRDQRRAGDEVHEVRRERHRPAGFVVLALQQTRLRETAVAPRYEVE